MELEENKRKERQKGAERESQLKCEETRAALLPVIGLAPFPKNLSSPLPCISCFPVQSLHPPLLTRLAAEPGSRVLLLLLPGFFLERGKAGGSRMWPAFSGID